MTVKRQALKNVNTASWLFGHPQLRADNNSIAYWARTTSSPYYQKGGGWQPCLDGRVQTGDDWAAVYTPVNELPLHKFEEALWSYYLVSAEASGVNIVIWAHDGDDFDKRAEITQLGNHADLEKGAGWNAFEFSSTTAGMFYFGEGVSTKTQLTAGTQYTWSRFQNDPLFRDWLIYRISIEFGWLGSGTFGKAFVGEIKLNEVPIPLVPRPEELVPVKQYATATSAAIAEALAPLTPFRLLSVDMEINTAGTTSEEFTVTKDAGEGDTYDTRLLTINTLTDNVTSLHQSFGTGHEYRQTDEIDCAWPNTENRTYGLTYTWEPI